MTLGISDEEIDLIAADGMRSAAGGIYESSVYRFAHAVEAAVLARWHAQDAGEPAGEALATFINAHEGHPNSPPCWIERTSADGYSTFKKYHLYPATQDSPQEALNARSPAAIDVLEKTP